MASLSLSLALLLSLSSGAAGFTLGKKGGTKQDSFGIQQNTMADLEYERFVDHLIKRVRADGITMQPEGDLQDLKVQVEQIVDQDIEGDIYETGSWKGGTSIFMASVLKAYEKLKGKHKPRKFWVFDSFEGFRLTNTEGDQKLRKYLSKEKYTAPLDSVRKSFKDYGLLDNQMQPINFVKGYFEQTVPGHINPNPIAILRLDGDLYSSTKVVLENLYDRVARGGYIIIDDYFWRPKQMEASTKVCREATDEFRKGHDITAPLVMGKGKPYWIKP